MNGSQLHYIVLVANEPLASEVAAFKQEMLEQFGCRAAMKSPAHITLIPPFFWSRGMQKILDDTFMAFKSSVGRLEIKVDGFGHFRRNVIYVQPVFNEYMMHLQFDCLKHFRPLLGDRIADKHPFHPHITIANRDLKSEDFDRAWAIFSNRPYRQTWQADKISLLQHNGRHWQVKEEVHWSGRH